MATMLQRASRASKLNCWKKSPKRGYLAVLSMIWRLLTEVFQLGKFFVLRCTMA
ncbi:hypothetical protein X743_18625 [Mesorhizobium sp. LNHC252B00]|nr:hypothetical protein X743_18625 [Mesorhizobium sp. LNHC252B00]